MIQITTCEFFQVMASLAGVQEIIRHHRIAGDAAHLDAAAAQHQQIILDVLIELGDVRVFEDRPQPFQRRRRVEQRRTFRARAPPDTTPRPAAS